MKNRLILASIPGGPNLGGPRLGDHTKECVCSLCGRRYRYVYLKGTVISHNTLKKCNSCCANAGRFSRKDRMIAYKGGRCQICGYNRCNRSLTFHHMDPSVKKLGFAGNHSRKWSVIQAELDKCLLLCHNCHNEVHAGVAKLEAKF